MAEIGDRTVEHRATKQSIHAHRAQAIGKAHAGVYGAQGSSLPFAGRVAARKTYRIRHRTCRHRHAGRVLLAVDASDGGITPKPGSYLVASSRAGGLGGLLADAIRSLM